MASDEDLAVSDAALWMLLLSRLAAVTTDERLELRNSKFMIFLPSRLSIYTAQAPFKHCSEYSMLMETSLVPKHGRCVYSL
jgi:hypothetical protein